MIRVDRDVFEAGNTAAKLRWPAQFFKHHIELQHAPLTQAEVRYLLSFYSQRSGLYDSFWLRDNIDRTGNYNVRFAKEIAPEQDASPLRGVGIELEEVAPRRMLPFIEEVTSGAGFTPVCWYDANRRIYTTHMGVNTEEVNFIDSANGNYPLAPGVSAVASIAGTEVSQWQAVTFASASTNWMKSGVNVSELASSAGDCTLFVIASRAASASDEIVFQVGNDTGLGKVFGFGITAGNYWEWYYGSGSFFATNARLLNTPASTYRSFAMVFTGGVTAKLYTNGALIGSDAITENYAAGPVALGATNNGAMKTNASVGQALMFAGALTLAQVKAVHNLFAPQYGLVGV
jgi:hypothetical protein